MTTLSVIMPCLNGAATLASQLHALAQQRWSESWELIIADNGSTDGSLELIERFRDRLPRMRVIDASGRRSCSYARNMGVRSATADRFAFCDVDDVVMPGWVAAMGEALAKHEFVASVVAIDQLNEPWLQKMFQDPGQPPMCFGFLRAASGCGFGVTRGVYETVGEFDESLRRLSDIDYSWRVQLSGVPIHLATSAVVQYRHRGTMRELLRQAYIDGVSELALNRKFAPAGMQPRSWREVFSSWRGLLRTLPFSGDRTRRGQWLVTAAELLGWMKGRIGGALTDERDLTNSYG